MPKPLTATDRPPRSAIEQRVEPLTVPPLPRVMIEAQVRDALLEDLGRAGDITSDATISPETQAQTALVARKKGVVAGLDLALLAFELIDPSIKASVAKPDGSRLEKGDVIATISGPARGILTAERVALNFLCHLSGIASATAAVVDSVKGTKARVICTRKTLPGLRTLQKYAVRVGGGFNHRFGLDDAVLIKDNHIAAAGGIRKAVERVRAAIGHLVKIELEVDTLAQLEEGLAVGVDAVLLDNMDVDQMRRAVAMVAGRAVTEASGGITPQTAPAIAATGVDLLSLGWLTHSVQQLDIGLDYR
jgi:nicotinate-nucleotide pyrophosphorylase (carboxylating)